MHFHCTESLYDNTCVRLKVLYMKHYNNTQPNWIMHYPSHSIPHSHPSPTQTHTSLPPLSPPPTPSPIDHWSASEDIKNQQQQNPKQMSHCFRDNHSVIKTVSAESVLTSSGIWGLPPTAITMCFAFSMCCKIWQCIKDDLSFQVKQQQ